LQTITALLEGTIVEVAVPTLCERVEAGMPLMTLVPLGQELVIDALVLNKDVGFVKVGDTSAFRCATAKLRDNTMGRRLSLKPILLHVTVTLRVVLIALQQML
jgi:multidrug resistance efflux pump